VKFLRWPKVAVRNVGRGVFKSLPPPAKFHLWGRWQTPPTYEYISEAVFSKLARQTQEKLSNGGAQQSFLFLPTQTWFSSGFQRPQQMARALAELGYPVIFCEPWDCIQAWVTHETVRQRRFVGLRTLQPNLHLLRCPEEMVTRLLSKAPPAAVMMTWPDQARFVSTNAEAKVVYEMIDDHSLIPYANEAWQKLHQHWVKRADLLVATADDLVDQLMLSRHDILLLPNGVRLEDWRQQKKSACPSDLIPARQSDVVVGYYGAIAEWFDWETWKHAATMKSNWAFVLIGYPYDGNTQAVRDRIQPFANMHYLEAKPYGELANYLTHFDIATIPFILNSITHSCSPVKLFEYMAAGKPIVCTAMREILKYKSIHFAKSAADFVLQLDKALENGLRTDYQELLSREARENTWRARAEKLAAALRMNQPPRRGDAVDPSEN
jgi:glycosyltransferase involved in cell wall biosynthesis